MLALRLLAAFLLAGLGLPAIAGADVLSAAPGRIVLRADDGGLIFRTQGTGGGIQRTATITQATPLPDGGTLLVGTGSALWPALYAAKIHRDGSLDPSFRVGLLTPSRAANFVTSRVMALADGKLLLVGSDGSDMQVQRLNADATLDVSYGVDGVARTPLRCGACRVAQLPDGGVVLLGEGAPMTLPGSPERPGASVARPWALTRLTPAGAVDRTFGTDGVATIRTDGYTAGDGLAVTAGGSILTVGTWSASANATPKVLLARLTSDGTPDPGFAGGTPVEVPTFVHASDLILQDGGDVIVVAGSAEGPSPSEPAGRLARYDASGSRDLTYGSGGFVDLGALGVIGAILPATGRALTVIDRLDGDAPRALHARGVRANGSLDPSRVIDLPFGGGAPSAGIFPPLAVPSLLQHSFTGTVVRRADGSYLVVGGISIAFADPPTYGLMGRWAVAALTPSLELDPAFGGAATPLRLSVALPRQRARTARTRRFVRVVMEQSAIGLTQIRVTHGRRAIANTVRPVFSTGPISVAVELTNYGYAFLRRHRNLRVVVRALGRDLLTTTTAAASRGRLP